VKHSQYIFKHPDLEHLQDKTYFETSLFFLRTVS